MANPQLYSITALSRHLGLSRTTIYELLYSEQLPQPAKILNKRRYFTAEQISLFLKEKTQ